MRVALTGGGGFIGSRVLERLVSDGDEATLIGPGPGKSPRTARLVADGRVRFVRTDADFRDAEVAREALGGDTCLVLLGYTLPRSREPTERLAEELALNVAANARLLEAARGLLGHVVFASSVSVYGAPERIPVPETDPTRPLTPYAVAKLACERAVTLAGSRSGMSVSILRYATVYGPGETVPRAIPNFIRAVLSGEAPCIDGDGLDEYDYVYVDDIVEATIAAIRRRADGVFNVGTGVATTTLTVARLVVQLCGADIEPTFRAARLPNVGRMPMLTAAA